MLQNQNSYEELIFKKEPKYIYIWLGLITILLIFGIIIGGFYKYNKFYNINGLVIKEGSDNYVQILLENDKLDIIKNDNLILNKKETDFHYEVSSYIYSDTGKAYREIKLFFENNYINGEIITAVFKSQKTTFLNEIKRKIKKGMM